MRHPPLRGGGGDLLRVKKAGECNDGELGPEVVGIRDRTDVAWKNTHLGFC